MSIDNSFGRNPVLPPEVCIPDGEAYVFGNRLYVYGSYDTNSKEYCSEEYHVAFTDDMRTWSVGEKSLDGKDIPWPNSKQKKKYYITDMGLKNPTPIYRDMLKEMHIPLGLMPKFLRPQMIDFGRFVPNRNLLFAPDCIEKSGKFYLNSAWVITAKVWLFRMFRQVPLKILFGCLAAELIRKFLLTMTAQLTITGASSGPMP